MEDIEKKVDCSCDNVDLENSRRKINSAIEGLRNAIQKSRKLLKDLINWLFQ